ncbi:MAG: protease inhibitor I42 family protein [Actinobacteria bacterium]|nr:protease inhibitor I42 family protein [Actinomycetota bacterium]
MSFGLESVRKIRFGLVAVGLGTLALGACGGDEASPDVTPDGTEFDVGGGDQFTIVLESNVTTGFSWQLEEPLDEGVLVLVDDDYIAPGTDAVGAPGKQELTFEAVSPGTTSIELWYIRPFDNPPDSADEASFPVTIESD